MTSAGQTPTSPPPPPLPSKQQDEQSSSPDQQQQAQQDERSSPAEEQEQAQRTRLRRPRKPIHTHHCRFCSHLLLATTRDISLLLRRREPALDGALILPLPEKRSSGSESESDSDLDSSSPEEPATTTTSNSKGKRTKQTDYTILLSTLLPDHKRTIIRRSDGFEKRLLLRCGRCRVVIGYVLDEVHFRNKNGTSGAGQKQDQTQDLDLDEGEGDGDGDGEGGIVSDAKVVYLLPGALVRTEELVGEGELKVDDREWSGWLKE